MTQHPSYSLAEAAQCTGLSTAKIRYYAETLSNFLAVEQDATGEWRLTADHISFFRVLASGGRPVDAIATLPTVTRPDLIRMVDDAGNGTNRERSADQHIVRESSADQHAKLNNRDHAGQECDAARPIDEGRSAGAAVDMTNLNGRINDLALHLGDLSEETKQVQVLLSRIISFLDGSDRPLPASVRLWEPPQL